MAGQVFDRDDELAFAVVTHVKLNAGQCGKRCTDGIQMHRFCAQYQPNDSHIPAPLSLPRHRYGGCLDTQGGAQPERAWFQRA
ncbi:hypothetical protein GCM10025771_02630 [Niveibacterium umoris]